MINWEQTLNINSWTRPASQEEFDTLDRRLDGLEADMNAKTLVAIEDTEKAYVREVLASRIRGDIEVLKKAEKDEVDRITFCGVSSCQDIASQMDAELSGKISNAIQEQMKVLEKYWNFDYNSMEGRQGPIAP